MTDDPAPKHSRLHPDIAAALERDDIPLSRIADLVGLDERTVSRTRLDGVTEERAARYRALDAWIEGRARAVRRGGAWELDALVQSVPAATLGAATAAARRLLVMAGEADAMATQLREEARRLVAGVTHDAPKVTPQNMSYVEERTAATDSPLTRRHARVMLGDMLNPALVRAMSSEMQRQTSGAKMHNVSIKLPDGFRERIEQAASEAGVSWAEYLRVLGFMFSKGPN